MILIAFRFITTCDSKKKANFKDENKFSFYIENYCYLGLKVILVILLSLRVFTISRNKKFDIKGSMKH